MDSKLSVLLAHSHFEIPINVEAIPQFSACWKKTEQVVVQKIDDDDLLRILAARIDSNYETYNHVEEWFDKLVGSQRPGAALKRRRR